MKQHIFCEVKAKWFVRVLIVLITYHSSLITSSAQDSLLLRDYQFVRQSDPWLTHRNAAALTRFAADNIVEAEASLVKGNGGLVNFDDSRNTLQGHVRAESFYRLSPRVVTFGAISYAGWTGRDMTGSAFMLRRTPFDLVEDSLTNPGRKHRDTYRLMGGVGADIWRGIALGARLDYTAANYAKYKDLRHKNKLMDLQLTLGTYVPVLPWLNVGADYTYHRQTESVDFGTYGKSERVYKTLIDYGAFMGRVEQFGNEGFTDKSREMPLFEDSHGASFQLELRPSRPPLGRDGVGSLSFFTTFDFAHATGYYGRRSPYTITYTNHERDILNLQGRLTYASRSSRFTLDVNYSSEDLTNLPRAYQRQRCQLLRILRSRRDGHQAVVRLLHPASCPVGHPWRAAHVGPRCRLYPRRAPSVGLPLSLLPPPAADDQHPFPRCHPQRADASGRLVIHPEYRLAERLRRPLHRRHLHPY